MAVVRIEQGDQLVAVMPDGDIRIGTVGAPVKVGTRAGRKAAVRPSIKWSVPIPAAVIKAVAGAVPDPSPVKAIDSR